MPVSVIKTPYIEKVGTKAGPILRWLLKNQKTKHYARNFLMVRSIMQLPKAARQGSHYRDYWQAGKSVEGIDNILSVGELMDRLRSVL